MSIRSTRNATIVNQEKQGTHQETLAVVAELTAGVYTVARQNNSNMVDGNVAAPNPIVYLGREHIKIGQPQYDLNAV